MNISVKRESIKEAHSAYEQAKDKIDKGITIVIFPEGTIPEGAPNLGTFKNGAFKLAMEKNIPIVPVSFVNNYRRLQIGPALRQLGGPGPSRVVMHEAVHPSDYATKGIGEMKKDIFAIIQRPIQEYHGDK